MRPTANATLLALGIALTSGCTYSSARNVAKVGSRLFVAGAAAAVVTLAAGGPVDICNLAENRGQWGCLLLAGAVGGLGAGSALGLVGLAGMAIIDSPATVDSRRRTAPARRRAAEQEAAGRAAQKAQEDLAARDPECVPRRVERLRAAGKIVDAHSRGLALLSIPVCVTATNSPAADASAAPATTRREEAAPQTPVGPVQP
jgi:hypothetical protein